MVNIGKCIGMLRGQKIFKEACPFSPGQFSVQRDIYRFVDPAGKVTKTIEKSRISKSDLLSLSKDRQNYYLLSSGWKIREPGITKDYKFSDRFVSKLQTSDNGVSSYYQVNLYPDGKHVDYIKSTYASKALGYYSDITKGYWFDGASYVKSTFGNDYKLLQTKELPPVWTKITDFITQ